MSTNTYDETTNSKNQGGSMFEDVSNDILLKFNIGKVTKSESDRDFTCVGGGAK